MPAIVRARSIATLSVLVAAVMAATVFVAPPQASAANHSHRWRMIHHAMRVLVHQKGDPYHYGSDGPHRFDCSGLTFFSFRKRSGFNHVPRTSSQQARFTNRIRRRQMRRGDFVFFYDHGSVYHVGVFAGWRNGHRLIIHAPYGNQHVKRERIWTNKWYPGSLRFWVGPNRA